MIITANNLLAEEISPPNEKARFHTAALGLGAEVNMNSPKNFAGGVLFNFDINLPTPAFRLATGISITSSNNFNGINVLEFSAMVRWYFLSLTHDGWFAQINAGYNYVDEKGAPIALISELRYGIRVPLGNSYIEPYGRIGYPVMWGAGVVVGMRVPMVKETSPQSDE